MPSRPPHRGQVRASSTISAAWGSTTSSWSAPRRVCASSRDNPMSPCATALPFRPIIKTRCCPDLAPASANSSVTSMRMAHPGLTATIYPKPASTPPFLTVPTDIVVASIAPVATYLQAAINVADLVALLVALIPTTIGALLSAIGIAAIDRPMQFNVLAMSGKAVEAAGDVQTLLLDKTGTITVGDRQANDFIAVSGREQKDLIQAAFLASYFDTTPEGRSRSEEHT